MDSNWTLQREGVNGTPTVNEWLDKQLQPNERVGVDPLLIDSSTSAVPFPHNCLYALCTLRRFLVACEGAESGEQHRVGGGNSQLSGLSVARQAATTHQPGEGATAGVQRREVRAEADSLARRDGQEARRPPRAQRTRRYCLFVQSLK